MSGSGDGTAYAVPVLRQPADNDPVYQHLEVDRVRETVVRLHRRAAALAVVDVVATSPGHAVDWVPLVESGINNVVFVAIAVLFLWERPSGPSVARRSPCSTGSARWRTWSTCTS